MKTIDEVVQRLDSIIAESENRADRIGYFAALYRKFTGAVRDGVRAGEFLDGARMERFDVAFATRYFDALDAHRNGRPLSRTWAVARGPRRTLSSAFRSTSSTTSVPDVTRRWSARGPVT